jgi:hypothetical protein
MAARAGFPCVECHRPDYDATADPDHVAANYPTTCQDCHSLDAWRPANFTDHDAFWPLTGAHAETACSSCHAGGVYAGTPDTCVGCHDPDYAATTAPSHVTAGFPKTCDTCHGTRAWVPAEYQGHDAYWPLVGKHAAAACESCHVGGVFAGTPTTCVACHAANYDATTDPDHDATGLPTGCAVCHTAAGWVPSQFDHAVAWPLVEAHADAACESCHAGAVYADPARVCVNCHQAAYDDAVAPDHVGAGFPTTCETCHGQTAWKPASFDHDTIWALSGAHQLATCESCHKGGVYAGTPRLCEGCHEADYQTANNPDHVDAGFPKTCDTCHGQTAWTPAAFDHDLAWPLTGAHVAAACEGCHADGVYAGTPKLCNGCHSDDYAKTTNPSHPNLKLSTTCETCHSTAAWRPAEFPKSVHDKLFRLSGGKHKAFGCADCHKTPEWSDWICVSCHTGDHALSKMDKEHIGEVGKYPSTMAAAATPDLGCKTCHPTGEED